MAAPLGRPSPHSNRMEFPVSNLRLVRVMLEKAPTGTKTSVPCVRCRSHIQVAWFASVVQGVFLSFGRCSECDFEVYGSHSTPGVDPGVAAQVLRDALDKSAYESEEYHRRPLG